VGGDQLMKRFLPFFLLLCALPVFGQTCAPPNYCAYTGTDIVTPLATPPNLGQYNNNNAIVYDTSYDSHGATWRARVARCTDQNTSSIGLQGASAGQGGGGSGIMWNTATSLMHINTGLGGSQILFFTPSSMACSKAITSDKNLTNPGSSSVAATFGDGQFSTSNPNRWWAFGVVGTDLPSGLSAQERTVITPYTFNISAGTYTFGAPVADLKYLLPINSNAPEWQASTAYLFGTYVTHTMVPGEFFTYQSNYAGFNLGDVIWPSYPSFCGYVLSATGTTGSTPPNWNSSSNCGQNATTITDGTAKWRSLTGPPKFLYQLTSASGTSGGSTPAFVPSNKHPDVLNAVSDNGLTWTNVGVNTPSVIWGSLTDVSHSDTRFVKGFSTNTYGAAVGSVGGSSGSCTYANCSGDQGTGVFVTAFDTAANVGHFINTLTDIQTDVACVGGTGYNCTGGNWALTTAGQFTAPACPFYLHDNSGNLNGDKVQFGAQTSYLGSSCGAGITSFEWYPYQTPFNATTQVLQYVAVPNHAAKGYNHLGLMQQGGTLYGFTSGAYATAISLSNPTPVPPIFWQATPCDSGTWFPGDPTQPCQLQLDAHWSWAYNPSQDDSTPIFSTVYNDNGATAGYNPVAAYQGEIVGVTTQPTWTSTSSPSPSQKQFRFTHFYNSQTSPIFSVQYASGQLSQDGYYYAFSTDWGNTWGSTTGSAPTLPISNPSVTCLGGYPWQASFAYTLGVVINPVNGISGASPYDAYQAIAVTGSSGATAPNWSSTIVGGTITDGGITWQDLGNGNCRGEVVIVELSPTPSGGGGGGGGSLRIGGSGVTFGGQVPASGYGITGYGLGPWGGPPTAGVTIGVIPYVPYTFFGLQFNSSTLATYPAPGGSSCIVGTQFCFGMIRYWDLANAVEVPFIFPTGTTFPPPATATPVWTSFDPWMAYAKTNSLQVVLNLARTPDWSSQYGSRCIAAGNPDASCSGPADFTCAYSGTQPTPPAGECWSNVDLAPDGSGLDSSYQLIAGDIATHLAGLSSSTYVNTAIWEPWNEANISGQWSGTVAQLITMTDDAAALILAANAHNIVTSPNSVEWDYPLVTGVAQYQQQYFGDPTLAADVGMISIHSYMAMNGSTGQFPCNPGPLPNCSGGVAPPEELVNLVRAVRSAVPTWPNYQILDSEFSWGQANTSFCDPDMRKAWVARSLLIGWAVGLYAMDWYHFDDTHNCSTALATPSAGGDAACISFGGPAVPDMSGWVECPAGVAYQQLYSWMVGTLMDQRCNGPVPPDTSTGTAWGIWTCHFINPDGTQSLAIWDTDPAYTCSGGVCPTLSVSIVGAFTKYFTVDNGTSTAIGGGCASGCSVNVGAKPILLHS
jgi:hypothetical protein